MLPFKERKVMHRFNKPQLSAEVEAVIVGFAIFHLRNYFLPVPMFLNL